MKKKLVLIVVSIVTLFALVAVAARVLVPGQTMAALVASKPAETFPDVDTSQLTEKQKHLITVLKAEYAAKAPGTKYAEGVEESWCADFVSWTMREAGAPLTNPNSGSWRIPGTYTLREYYQAHGAFRAPDSGYVPKVGDVALYDGPGWFGQHTNIILSYDGTNVTTIGGNENNAIHVQTRPIPVEGLVGYGVSAL